MQAQLCASLKLYGASAELVHFFTKFAGGTKDTIWIPQLAAEEGWIVVSADRGKHSPTGEKLPEICSAFGVTHITLSSALSKRGWYYKSLAFETHWGELLATVAYPKGTGFRLSIAGERVFRLQKVSDPPSPPTPFQQRPLF